MRTCPSCQGKLIKYGFLKKENTQRYKCKKCHKCCSEAHKRTFGTLRSDPQKITTVIRLLTEGVGIRASARLVNVHRDTVLRILKHAGERSRQLLQKKLVDVPVEHVQCDEIHTTVLRKSIFNTDPETDTHAWGDYFIYFGLESRTKLLFMPVIGKRTFNTTSLFADTLSKSISGRAQITTDGFRPYKQTIKEAFGNRADFAQFYKEYNMLTANKRSRYNPKYKDSAHKFVVRSGSPSIDLITTAHVERVNLTLRTTNRRFNRRTICFSKAQEYLAYSVWLFAAAYNFMTPHSTLGKKITPAMANGLASKPWNVEDLLSFYI